MMRRNLALAIGIATLSALSGCSGGSDDAIESNLPVEAEGVPGSGTEASVDAPLEPRRAAAAMVRQNGLHLLRAADPFAPVLLACKL